MFDRVTGPAHPMSDTKARFPSIRRTLAHVVSKPPPVAKNIPNAQHQSTPDQSVPVGYY